MTLADPEHRACGLSRRKFLLGAVAGATAALQAAEKDRELQGKALIAITLDLEMLRNFPTWEMTHWDYEKGNLNDEAKGYTVEACRRVKSYGGVLHNFAVGQVFEHEKRRVAERDRRGGPPRREPYLRPCLCLGAQARGSPISLSARAVADRRPRGPGRHS